MDVFRFDTGTGSISLQVRSPAPEANLHILAELLNSAGQVLQSNPVSSLSATFTPFLSAGAYYLRISGIGAGDPATTGYSDYGSVGNYVITGTVVGTGALQAPVAVASAATTSGVAPLTVGFSGQGSSDADGSIVSYHWNFGNGTSSTAINPTCTYSTAGTFTAVLTVTDNDGLQGTASVTVNVAAAPANQAPVAVVSAAPVSGPAPLPVTFSGAQSHDPDGSIVSYAWSFGDGETSTAMSPTKTYATAGTFLARLTVTDNSGATGSATVNITVQSAPVATKEIDVADYALTTTTAPRGTSAVATIVVRDQQNQPVSGATITLQWSGLASGVYVGITDAAGRVAFTSKATKRSGEITGTITAVTAPAGATYKQALFTAPMVQSVPVN
jgi:PKD repeat protein